MLNPANVKTVFNEARVELTGVSDAALKSQLFEVLDEFFRDTSSWRETLMIPVNALTTDFHIEPSEGQIIRLDKILDQNGSFIPALMPHVGHIILQHPPNTNVTYFVTVICNVSLPLDQHGLPIAPNFVLEKWHLGIKAGLLGNFFNQANKSYSDNKKALYWLSKFRQFIGNTRSAVLRANTSGAQAWRFPQAFRATTQRGGVPPLSGGERTF